VAIGVCKNYACIYKTQGPFIRNLLDIVLKCGDFLLNVGPANLGEFPWERNDILQQMGKWMKINAEAVYGPKESPGGLFSCGNSTKKEIVVTQRNCREPNLLIFRVK
jgi:alpha-L-fucosidase